MSKNKLTKEDEQWLNTRIGGLVQLNPKSNPGLEWLMQILRDKGWEGFNTKSKRKKS